MSLVSDSIYSSSCSSGYDSDELGSENEERMRDRPLACDCSSEDFAEIEESSQGEERKFFLTHGFQYQGCQAHGESFEDSVEISFPAYTSSSDDGSEIVSQRNRFSRFLRSAITALVGRVARASSVFTSSEE